MTEVVVVEEVVIAVVVLVEVEVIIIILITLLTIYLLGDLRLSQTVGGVRLSQGKGIHPIP